MNLEDIILDGKTQLQMAAMANLMFYMYFTSKKVVYKNPRNYILIQQRLD